jgi:hypothetical protein
MAGVSGKKEIQRDLPVFSSSKIMSDKMQK